MARTSVRRLGVGARVSVPAVALAMLACAAAPASAVPPQPGPRAASAAGGLSSISPRGGGVAQIVPPPTRPVAAGTKPPPPTAVQPPAVPTPLVGGGLGPQTISADVLTSPQTNGTVYSVAIVGNVVIAGGDFTSARPHGAPAGVGQVPRHNLLEFNLTTGALLPFAPVVTGTPFTATGAVDFCDALANGQTSCSSIFRIKVSPDGSRFYVGGDFTAIDGQPRDRVAAFATATGALVATFHPVISSRVRALAVTSTAVYVGGAFTSVNGATHLHLVGLTQAGSTLAAFNASTDDDVWSMAPSVDGRRVVIGGSFTTLSGVTRPGLGTALTATGAPGPWGGVGALVFGTPGTAAVTDLAVSAGTVYASGYDFGSGSPLRFEGRLAADVATGTLVWDDRCLGDTQALAVAGGVVYSASHSHDCSALGVGAFDAGPSVPDRYQRIVAESTAVAGTNAFGEPRPGLLAVFPSTNGGPAGCLYCNGPWAVAANGRYVVYGGEFTLVNGRPQQGLAEFEVRNLAPRKVAPAPFSAGPALSGGPGAVQVSWPATWDRDDATLTYTVYRDGRRVAALTCTSYWWTYLGDGPPLGVTDTGVPAGTHHYTVTATDSNGNVTTSPAGGVVVT